MRKDNPETQKRELNEGDIQGTDNRKAALTRSMSESEVEAAFGKGDKKEKQMGEGDSRSAAHRTGSYTQKGAR